LAKPDEKKELAAHVKKLDRIYREFGANSGQFYAQVKNLIVFVQLRFIGIAIEDVGQNVFVRILESLSYYEEDKSNIGTWVFSIARNCCSSYLYALKKRQRESEEPLLFVQVADQYHEGYLERDAVDRFFESHFNIMIEPPDDYYDEFLQLDSDNLLKKALLWESLAPAFAT
jgi:DNA-directed RNA polymerase specialized sigma24 family protein